MTEYTKDGYLKLDTSAYLFPAENFPIYDGTLSYIYCPYKRQGEVIFYHGKHRIVTHDENCPVKLIGKEKEKTMPDFRILNEFHIQHQDGWGYTIKERNDDIVNMFDILYWEKDPSTFQELNGGIWNESFPQIVQCLLEICSRTGIKVSSEESSAMIDKIYRITEDE